MTEREIIGNVGEFVAALAVRFPRHATEIAAWTADYARVLVGLDADSLTRTLERTLDGWKGNRFGAPKPPDLVITRAVGIGALPLFYRAEDGSLRCTRAGHERARGLARRMVDDALRNAPVPLTSDEAQQAAVVLRDRAWLAAQREVITDTVEPIELTAEDLDEIRSRVAWVNRTDSERAAAHGFKRLAQPPAPSARTASSLKALADQHRASFMAPMADC